MSLFRKVISSIAIVCLGWSLSASEALGQRATQSLERPKVSTPLRPTEVLAVLREAHVQEYGKPPSKKRLAMAWAQVAFENDWGRVMWNHNFGNVGPGPTHTWYQHSPKARYRHFDTFIDGARAYWRVVTWCRTAIAAFDAGQPEQAAENLKRCGYYESDDDSYAKGLAMLYSHAMGRIIPEEERERKEREQGEREARDWELRHQFTPVCACSQWP